jgi:hypothetical protein
LCAWRTPHPAIDGGNDPAQAGFRGDYAMTDEPKSLAVTVDELRKRAEAKQPNLRHQCAAASPLMNDPG